MNENRKSKIVAAILAWFLGVFGAHRYYLGYKKRGIFMTVGAICASIGTGISMGRTTARLLNGYNIGTADTILAVFGLLLALFGAVVAIMALVDFIKILCNKLLPADESGWQTKDGLSLDNAGSGIVGTGIATVAQPSQYIIDSLAAVRAFYQYHDLKEKEIITKEEFEAKKQQLLGL